MELKTYWAIVRRRWWLVAGLVLVTALVSVVYQPSRVLQYRSTVRLGAQLPQQYELAPTGQYAPSSGALDGTRYFDFFLDDLVELVKSGGFADAVQQRLANRGEHGVGGSFDARKMRRLLTITATSGDPRDALLLATTARDLLAEPNNQFVTALSSLPVKLLVAEEPTSTVQAEARSYLNLAIRVLLALLAGLALVFLLDYFDDSVRGGPEIEPLLGVPVVGELPREPRLPNRWPRLPASASK